MKEMKDSDLILNDNTKKFKVIFLGDASVGKSSILNRYVNETFREDYQATVGLDFLSKNVKIGETNVRLLLYDTAGQEKFKSLIPMYIRDANVIIIVYDITKRITFENTSNWVEETSDLKRNDAIFALLGNKSDLEDERKVTRKEGMLMAKERDLIFAEVSAKTGDNLENFFNEEILNAIKQKFDLTVDKNDEQNVENEQNENSISKSKNEEGRDSNKDNTFDIKAEENKNNQKPQTKKGGCCGK